MCVKIEDLRYACKNHHLLITKHMTLRCEERKISIAYNGTERPKIFSFGNLAILREIQKKRMHRPIQTIF